MKQGQLVIIRNRRPETNDRKCRIVSKFTYGVFTYYLVKLEGLIRPLPYYESELQAIGEQLPIQFGRENLKNGCFIKYHDGRFVCHANVMYCKDEYVRVKDRHNGEEVSITYDQIFYIGEILD